MGLRNLLTAADRVGTADDEAYLYDENGNRDSANGDVYATGDDNRLTTDGTYNYVYDGEGNRKAKFIDNNGSGLLDAGDTDITEYDWDHRNRLISLTDRDTFGGSSTQIVSHTYDAHNQWISRTVDPDGDSGSAAIEKTIFIHDAGQIVMQFDDTGSGDLDAADLSHRYLWGAGVDQILADEQVTSTSNPGDVLWPTTDHLGTVRDVVDSTGTVRLHFVYDAFGVVTDIDYFDSAGNAISAGAPEAVDFSLRQNGLYFDDSTGLLQNRARWRELETNQFLSEDPIKDGRNWRIFVDNSPTMYTDSSGLQQKTVFLKSWGNSKSNPKPGSQTTQSLKVASGRWVVDSYKFFDPDYVFDGSNPRKAHALGWQTRVRFYPNGNDGCTNIKLVLFRIRTSSVGRKGMWFPLPNDPPSAPGAFGWTVHANYGRTKGAIPRAFGFGGKRDDSVSIFPATPGFGIRPTVWPGGDANAYSGWHYDANKPSSTSAGIQFEHFEKASQMNANHRYSYVAAAYCVEQQKIVSVAQWGYRISSTAKTGSIRIFPHLKEPQGTTQIQAAWAGFRKQNPSRDAGVPVKPTFPQPKYVPVPE